MADNTGIEWTDATWNPVRGCTRVSQGCVNCYAETVAARFSDKGQAYEGLATRSPARWTGEVKLIESALDQPLRWTRARKIFVNSMSDLFHEKLPDESIDVVFAVMALAPWHIFQVLTKRAERMREYIEEDFRYERIYNAMGALHERAPLERVGTHPYRRALPNGMAWPLPNVWLGVSVENQESADERTPLLLQTPAAKRFLSCEPLLGSIEIRDSLRGRRFNGRGEEITPSIVPDHNRRVDWVIAGGESGKGARPMHPAWAASLRDQCKTAGVPFFFKQWGEWAPDLIGLPIDEADGSAAPNVAWPDGSIAWGKSRQHGGFGTRLLRVGKKEASRLLDGVDHSEFPTQ